MIYELKLEKLIVVVVFVILVIYLKMFNIREKFGLYKRRVNGLYQGLNDHSDADWTMDEYTHHEVISILRAILVRLNCQAGMKYYLNGIDNVTTESLPNNKLRYIVDVFLHELDSRTTKRMMIIMKVCRVYKNVEVETLTMSNAIKLPEKHFSNHPNEANHPSLIIKDENVKSGEYHIMGVNSSNLDFSKLKRQNVKEVPTPVEFTKWILPLSIHECQENVNNYPCRKLSDKWDCNGIKYSDCKTKNCQGIKSHNKEIPIQPYQNPTLNRMETEGNEHDWMFNLARGISSFPHGSSNGK
jgi:hypothetical protein